MLRVDEFGERVGARRRVGTLVCVGSRVVGNRVVGIVGGSVRTGGGVGAALCSISTTKGAGS